MKIYTKVTISMDTGEVLDSESYEYNGPVAECKGGGGSSTQYVQSPEARGLYQAAYPAAYQAGTAAGRGQPLYNTGNMDYSYAGYFPTTAYNVPEQYQVGGAEEMLYQPGMISPEVIKGLQQPGLDIMGQAVEQFGGGYGSARGGISGAGQELFGRTARMIAPQMALATQQMVSPALQTAFGARTGAARDVFGAQVGAEQAAFGGQLAQGQQIAAHKGLEYQARQQAMFAPYQALSGVASQNVPTAVQQPQGGKK